MPLFEVDAQRPLLVQAGQQQAGREPGVGTTAHRVVESHIDGLLGEQIFPVAPGNGPGEPHLMALDATGSPVVVELVADLDEAALTRALDHAGAAGRLTRADLASRYHGGTSAFHRDVAAFYDSVPITRSQPGRSSARLIIICQEASEEILNAVDFLRQPTMPVEVLKMGVVHSADGRRFVDVSPLVIHPASEPTAPRLSGSHEMPTLDRRNPGVSGPATSATPVVGHDPEVFAEGVAVGLALTGKQPAGTQASERPASRAEPAPSRADRRRAAASWAGDDREGFGDTREQPPLPRGSGLPLPSTPPPPPPPAEPEAPFPVARPSEALPTSLPGGSSASRRTAPVRRRSRADRFAGSDVDAPEETPRSYGGFDEPTPERTYGDDHGLGDAFAAVAAPAFDLPAPSPWDAPRQEPPIPEPRWSGADDDLPRLQVPPLEPPRLSGVPPLDTDDPYGSGSGYSSGSSYPTGSSYGDSAYSGGSSYPGSAYSGGSSYGTPDQQYGTPDQQYGASEHQPYAAPELQQYAAPDHHHDPLGGPLDPAPWAPPEEHAPRAGTFAPAFAGIDASSDPDLVALAQQLGRSTGLTWSRPRRRQHFEAILHADGTIELPDGSLYRNPDHAASSASGSPTADGWSVWKLADGSGSLIDAFRRYFA
ncbi:hypothetical protein LEP48_13825 [Isoptericola sp. NEAU-Y5]|uniref:RAMA domain-containing protein n=1 Tax=Isoptericola luteus TaxID=2879484 RepID=A0ABS7ZIV9_9MICO|nr:hypothetical protein [Isoptericola sp. NEAU-Y5]MCA5894417.1 hypothetical protein [Isoptericola sp. NEAU-Y5]